jgi:hypothetical protein
VASVNSTAAVAPCARERKRERDEEEVDAGFKYELVAPI